MPPFILTALFGCSEIGFSRVPDETVTGPGPQDPPDVVDGDSIPVPSEMYLCLNLVSERQAFDTEDGIPTEDEALYKSLADNGLQTFRQLLGDKNVWPAHSIVWSHSRISDKVDETYGIMIPGEDQNPLLNWVWGITDYSTWPDYAPEGLSLTCGVFIHTFDDGSREHYVEVALLDKQGQRTTPLIESWLQYIDVPLLADDNPVGNEERWDDELMIGPWHENVAADPGSTAFEYSYNSEGGPFPASVVPMIRKPREEALEALEITASEGEVIVDESDDDYALRFVINTRKKGDL